MEKGKFRKVAAVEGNEKWENCIKRQSELYRRNVDIRNEFTRDYNRILHCTAYRRLKHKTQVFFATENDHICTRIEHVNHVASVSYSLSSYLG
ncbi:MAG: metal-dependent phosphohydrolase, partial [Firmicutes bacterium HGW-Firmicutes-13]